MSVSLFLFCRYVHLCCILYFTFGEGNGNPLQYSCLENPMDGGGWKATVHGVAKSDRTEQLHFHFSLSCIGEGNGNPLQCSCLENPRDGAGWWATVYGVAQSRTRLKRLSSSSSSSIWFLPFSFWLALLSMILGPSMLLQMTLFHSFFYSLVYILRDWGQEEKGTTKNEMARWHHRLDGHEFEWTLGVGDGQGSLECCDSRGHKELDTTVQLNWTELNIFFFRFFPL